MNTAILPFSPAEQTPRPQWLPRIHNLVAAIDFWAGSERSGSESIVEAVALLIKEQPETTVTLLHVVPDDLLLEGDFDGLPDTLATARKGAAMAELDKLRTGLPAEVHVELLVRGGDPATEICRAANDSKADCILVASHGRTGFKRVMMGSIAEEVVHGAGCTVLVLKLIDGKAVLPLKLDRLAVAFDGSDGSRAALATALGLVRHGGQHLKLIQAVEPIPYAAPELPVISENVLLQEARERLEETSRHIYQPLAVTTEVRVGKPWRVIQEVAEQDGSDLLIIGAHEHWRLGDFMLGSTAERVVRHTACPVLVVRPSVQGTLKSVRG